MFQLMAYTIVAVCVLLLKYEFSNDENITDLRDGFFNKLFNSNQLSFPTKFTSALVTVIVSLYVFSCAWLALVITFMGEKILEADALATFLVTIPVISISLLMVILVQQPRSPKTLTFSVPFTPWFPAVSIMINIYLLAQLGALAWIRFVVWIAIGLLIYTFYGRRYSKVKELVLINEVMEKAFDETDSLDDI